MSPLFVGKARERFGDLPFVSYRALDVESDPISQGLSSDRFDLVIAMDRQNLAHLQRLAGGRATPELALLRRFDPTAAPGAEVPDPWAGGEDGFEEVLDQCERACRGLLAHVRERLGVEPEGVERVGVERVGVERDE